MNVRFELTFIVELSGTVSAPFETPSMTRNDVIPQMAIFQNEMNYGASKKMWNLLFLCAVLRVGMVALGCNGQGCVKLSIPPRWWGGGIKSKCLEMGGKIKN